MTKFEVKLTKAQIAKIKKESGLGQRLNDINDNSVWMIIAQVYLDPSRVGGILQGKLITKSRALDAKTVLDEIFRSEHEAN